MAAVQKLLLVSILFATLALPMRAARDPSPTRGFRKVAVGMVGAAALYLIALLYIYPRLF